MGSRGEQFFAPLFAAPEESTRENVLPERLRLTPSGSPVITRVPKPAPGQAMLREFDAGGSCGNPCRHVGAPAGGTLHQLPSTTRRSGRSAG